MKNKNLWKLLTNSALALSVGFSSLSTTFAMDPTFASRKGRPATNLTNSNTAKRKRSVKKLNQGEPLRKKEKTISYSWQLSQQAQQQSHNQKHLNECLKLKRQLKQVLQTKLPLLPSLERQQQISITANIALLFLRLTRSIILLNFPDFSDEILSDFLVNRVFKLVLDCRRTYFVNSAPTLDRTTQQIVTDVINFIQGDYSTKDPKLFCIDPVINFINLICFSNDCHYMEEVKDIIQSFGLQLQTSINMSGMTSGDSTSFFTDDMDFTMDDTNFSTDDMDFTMDDDDCSMDDVD